MLDFIYTLLIAPLEYWMHAALVWGYSHTEAWGPAIVVMSLAVNVVILPIYIKAEKWQEGERALRKSFEAKEAMIKRTFKGQERFAMISTMHRQAGYSPFFVAALIVGLFPSDSVLLCGLSLPVAFRASRGRFLSRHR